MKQQVLDSMDKTSISALSDGLDDLISRSIDDFEYPHVLFWLDLTTLGNDLKLVN